MCVCTSAEVLKVAVSFFAVTNWLPEVATGPWQHFATIFSRLPSFPLNEAEKENWTLHRPATTCQFLLLDQEEKVPNIRFGHQCKLCFIGLDKLPCRKIINGSVIKPFSAKSIIIRAGKIPKFFEYRPSNPLNGWLGQGNAKKIDLKASNQLLFGLLRFIGAKITV